MSHTLRLVPLFAVFALWPIAASGQTTLSSSDVASRDANGRLNVRATRLEAPLRLDGHLDESVYRDTPPVGGFTQVDPQFGAPASQKTDVWMLYDQDNVYVALRIWESNPERMVANEMRHDAAVQLSQNELITIALDTFRDRRSSFYFALNPIGGRAEGQSSNETQANGDWNGIWKSEVGRFDGGWSAEVAIPFKTLRYPGPGAQDWGVQIQRVNRWKNEVSVLTPSDPGRGSAGFMLASKYANLIGLETPAPGLNLDIKPYAIADLTTDHTAAVPRSNDGHADAGLDVKYAITPGLSGDFTYNTDFAQVEADEQQVNLTRFSLFFPEKREFFLENSGTFSFGGTVSGGLGVAGDAPVMFYSRRIGLNGTQEVPLRVGGRVTGRIGRFSIGAVDIQSDDENTTRTRPTNFAVARVKRDILRKSAVGVIATSRSVTQSGVGTNQLFGADATLGFFTNLMINAYWARTETTDRPGDAASYRGQLDFSADRYGVQVEHLKVGANFNPEIGFLRRPDIRKEYGLARFSPRPKRNKVIRKYTYQGTGTYIENGAGRVESKIGTGEFDIDFQNSDKLTVLYTGTEEYVPAPFRIAPQVTVPVGRYHYATVATGFAFGQQRPVSGKVTLEAGTFYDGDRTTLTVSSGRMRVLPQFSIEPTASFNHVTLQAGSFDTNLVGSRINYSLTPYMFVSALLQWNSSTHTVATNARLRWEYLPGSELFVVYNDTRDTTGISDAGVLNRAIIVKVNRLLRF